MANKKKQHYVSQFLLKNFSQLDNNKLINIYNRGNDKLITEVSLRKQAQEADFYGKDLTFENFLGITETKASAVIKEIERNETLPGYKDKSYSRLLHFIMLYAFRTKSSVTNTEERINSAFKVIAKYLEEFKDIDFEHYRIKHPEPAAFNLASYMDNWVITYDLNSVLLINKTERDFFISDNPFVQYNPFMLKRKLHEIAGGLVNKGLIILFPFSTRYYFMMYDSWAYKTTESDRKIEIAEFKDVYNLNLLQSISADDNLYFSNTSDSDYVVNLSRIGLENKKDEHINKELEHPENPNRKLMLSYYLEHMLTLEFGFLKEKENAKTIKNLDVLYEPRNQEIVDWIEMDKEKLHTTSAQKQAGGKC